MIKMKYTIQALESLRRETDTPINWSLNAKNYNLIRASQERKQTLSEIPQNQSGVRTVERVLALRSAEPQPPQISLDREPELNVQTPSKSASISNESGFARFLKDHASPNTQRVNAGGRIVPMTPPDEPLLANQEDFENAMLEHRVAMAGSLSLAIQPPGLRNVDAHAGNTSPTPFASNLPQSTTPPTPAATAAMDTCISALNPEAPSFTPVNQGVATAVTSSDDRIAKSVWPPMRKLEELQQAVLAVAPSHLFNLMAGLQHIVYSLEPHPPLWPSIVVFSSDQMPGMDEFQLTGMYWHLLRKIFCLSNGMVLPPEPEEHWQDLNCLVSLCYNLRGLDERLYDYQTFFMIHCREWIKYHHKLVSYLLTSVYRRIAAEKISNPADVRLRIYFIRVRSYTDSAIQCLEHMLREKYQQLAPLEGGKRVARGIFWASVIYATLAGDVARSEDSTLSEVKSDSVDNRNSGSCLSDSRAGEHGAILAPESSDRGVESDVQDFVVPATENQWTLEEFEGYLALQNQSPLDTSSLSSDDELGTLPSQPMGQSPTQERQSQIIDEELRYRSELN
ncbi:hypothetical protein N7462_004719 [Penicillium macrosclerotiorum]|uniref:uncharacterized protein n=1 Tax=Penicillium macrosclerotiorum TaxID=303699 RepID=UPI002546CB02|nr:uncharacterized protein N7462_004719 [Penicillium macrosclerotiorum]KAJ5690327.1 hypothetical protein N7462_004719 [Penicillium macrosclerotiorum]